MCRLRQSASMLVGFLALSCSRTVVPEAPGQSHAQTPAPAASRVRDNAKSVLWIRAESLLPAWGFYQNGKAYGDRPLLGKVAAWVPANVPHAVRWVVSVPRAGSYDVWVRRYGGYGSFDATIDGTRPGGARAAALGPHYVWADLGRAHLQAGPHSVAITVRHGMLDAILLSPDDGFDPNHRTLPSPVEPRTWVSAKELRLQPSSGAPAIRAWPVERYGIPTYGRPPQAPGVLQLWGAPGQYVAGALKLRVRNWKLPVALELDELDGPQKIASRDVDIRSVWFRKEPGQPSGGRGAGRPLPTLLVRDSCGSEPTKGHQGGFGGGAALACGSLLRDRYAWVTIHIPANTAPGEYRGNLSARYAGAGSGGGIDVPVVLRVLSIHLEPVAGYYGVYYPAQPSYPTQPNFVGLHRYRAELADMARHGLNAVTLYGAASTMVLAQRAGLTQAPCLMSWPGREARREVSDARHLGFSDLLFYGVDEPKTPEQVARCQHEAERRTSLGLHMMTAINSKSAAAALMGVVDHPVYNLYVFDKRNNPVVQQAIRRHERPVSYWVTGGSFPLAARAFGGLYNLAVGYDGTIPWAYGGGRTLAEEKDLRTNRLAYPDEFGDPIPMPTWEAYRDGIDDVRYLQALERAIDAADRRVRDPRPGCRGLRDSLAAAKQTLHDEFDSIGGPWFVYLSTLEPGALDQGRRRLADAIVRLRKSLAGRDCR